MELSQHNLLDELIMAPKTDNPIPNEFFHNTWNFTPFEFDQTPDFLQFPVTNYYNNPSLLELISPPSDQYCLNYPFPYEDDLHPFLDALTSSPILDSFYDPNDDFPPMSIHHRDVENVDDTRFLQKYIDGFEGGTVGCCNVESGSRDENPKTGIDNVGIIGYGEKKRKSKKPVGQPSKNLMAERRRRKRLNDRLSMLRSIVPKISKMDRTSILGDTIDYMRELLDKIQNLREDGLDEKTTDQINLLGDYLKETKPEDSTQVRNPPKFDVERRNQDTKVEVCCATKPGLLLSTLSTLDAFGLGIQQCVISCFSDFSLQASCFEVAEHRALVSCEDVKQALFRNAGYGGRCI
ncbi:hypothetical protein OROGR_007972 [Orobanche gracilis]